MKLKWLSTLFLCMMPAAIYAFQFSQNGKAACVLVCPTEIKELDQLALEELKTYLGKMTGAEFAVKKETEQIIGPAIYIGKTKATAQQGIDTSKFQDEEWLILEKNNQLILTGGHPAGTYYAVRSLLEKAGCWCLAPDQEIVPTCPSLKLDNLNEHKKPAIPGRNFYDGYPWLMHYTKVPEEGVKAYWTYRLRNRYNGGHGIARKEMLDAFYLSKYFKMTHQVPGYHTMSFYIDPALYKTHPEYFAMNARGKRVPPKVLYSKQAVETGYCYTNPQVRNIAAENLLKVIAIDRKTGTADDWPLVYDFSALDRFPHICLCPECKKLVEKKGTDSDLLLDFINDLATRVRAKYPDVILRTFAAYNGANEPPVSTKAEPNVLLQYCDTFSHADCYRPLTHPVNQNQLRQLKSWLSSGGKMALWDYGNIGGVYFFPPRIECVIDSFPGDLKLFRDGNILAIFYECETDEVLKQNFSELTEFLYAHMAVDPDQDMERLIQIFMDGYYGPAAPMMKEYLEAVRKGVRDCKNPQLTNRVANWPHMSLKFMTDSYQKFKTAEKLTAPESVYRKRLHYEMLPLLYLMLQNSDGYKTAFAQIGTSEQQLLQEFKTCSEKFISRMNGADLARPRKTVAKTLALLSQRYPVPAAFKDKSPELLRVVGPARFRKFPHIGSSIVDDPEAMYGKAIKGAGLNKNWHGLNRKIQATKTLSLPSAFFKYGDSSLNITKIPQDEKYHWYKFPRPDVLTSVSYLWGQAWALQVDLSHLFVLGDGDPSLNLWECWVSLKFTGPEWVKGSTKDNAIYLDGVVLTRPQQKTYAIPEKFKDKSPDSVRVVGPEHFRQFPQIGSGIVDDPEALYEKAIKGSGLNTNWHGVNKKIEANKNLKLSPAFFKFGNIPLNITQIPQDEKYHWYHFARPWKLTGKSYLWGQAWAIQVGLGHLFEKGNSQRNLWECWVSLKFTGPEWVKGSTKDNAIYLDGVVLTREQGK